MIMLVFEVHLSKCVLHIVLYTSFAQHVSKFHLCNCMQLQLIFTAVKSHKYPIIDLPILLMEKEMATHSSILAWKNPWTEEPGRYSPWSHKKIWHDFATKQHSIDDHLLFCFVKYEQRYEHSSASLVAQTVKKSACNAGDVGSIPCLGRSPGRGHGNPLQYSWLENPHGQRSLLGYSPWGRKESDTTEWLSTAHEHSYTYILVHLYTSLFGVCTSEPGISGS